MNKIFIFSVFIAIFLISCEKNEEIVEAPPKYDYEWPGSSSPRPIEFLSKVYAFHHGYRYSFRMHLDGSPIDPNPINVHEFVIPRIHSKFGGLQFYQTAHDTMYFIDSVAQPWVYYHIRTRPVRAGFAPIDYQYNIAIKRDGEVYWFSIFNNPNRGPNNFIKFRPF